MKRILSLICVLVLVAVQCQAGWWIRLGEEAGGGGSTIISQLNYSDTVDLSENGVAQTITMVGTTIGKLRVHLVTGTGNTITARIGYSTDLRDFIAESTATATAGWVEFDFNLSGLTNSGSLAFGVRETTGSLISRQASDDYPGGQYYYNVGGTTWITNGGVSSFDLAFEIDSL